MLRDALAAGEVKDQREDERASEGTDLIERF